MSQDCCASSVVLLWRQIRSWTNKPTITVTSSSFTSFMGKNEAEQSFALKSDHMTMIWADLINNYETPKDQLNATEEPRR